MQGVLHPLVDCFWIDGWGVLHSLLAATFGGEGVEVLRLHKRVGEQDQYEVVSQRESKFFHGVGLVKTPMGC